MRWPRGGYEVVLEGERKRERERTREESRMDYKGW